MAKSLVVVFKDECSKLHIREVNEGQVYELLRDGMQVKAVKFPVRYRGIDIYDDGICGYSITDESFSHADDTPIRTYHFPTFTDVKEYIDEYWAEVDDVKATNDELCNWLHKGVM